MQFAFGSASTAGTTTRNSRAQIKAISQFRFKPLNDSSQDLQPSSPVSSGGCSSSPECGELPVPPTVSKGYPARVK
jgi:hypothetical protein